MITIFRTFIILLVLAVPSFASEPRTSVPIGDSPRKGPENAPVTLVEFIDFQ